MLQPGTAVSLKTAPEDAASPPPPPTPSPHQPASLAASQTRQRLPEFLQVLGPHGVALAPHHAEAPRPVPRRQVARLQPPGLAVAQSQTRHTHAVLDLVVDGDAIAVQMQRCGQRIEPRPLVLRYTCVGVERER